MNKIMNKIIIVAFAFVLKQLAYADSNPSEKLIPCPIWKGLQHYGAMGLQTVSLSSAFDATTIFPSAGDGKGIVAYKFYTETKHFELDQVEAIVGTKVKQNLVYAKCSYSNDGNQVVVLQVFLPQQDGCKAVNSNKFVGFNCSVKVSAPNH